MASCSAQIILLKKCTWIQMILFRSTTKWNKIEFNTPLLFCVVEDSTNKIGLELEPKPCVKTSPTVTSLYFSTSRTSLCSFPARELTFHIPRASFCSQRSDHQSCHLHPGSSPAAFAFNFPPLPSSHCKLPHWPFPQVVSWWEGELPYFELCTKNAVPATGHLPLGYAVNWREDYHITAPINGVRDKWKCSNSIKMIFWCCEKEN